MIFVETVSLPAVAFWFTHDCWKYPGLLPSTDTLSPSGRVDIPRLWIRVEQDSPEEPKPSGSTEVDTAGGWASTYDRRFVPVADLDGATLAVDTRPGPL
ncbi:hypothetical protein ASG84_11615 [Rhodococcus sp. Leaf278]|uniref:hypothetical protein n=1 Tax=Rhodococcus sp. Leaf278 TaxID=1736319 RepID=UPI00070C2696|nr:hypothetical protein [Rhodococcus sp. Leaf278]KQU44913.1 hypothetical protein ASG84_11615 [Rhodococcus sp. Leaf278]